MRIAGPESQAGTRPRLVINYRRLLITSMAIRPKRASLTRVIIGLASLAFPLIATGAAQAALAGATPATTTQRPDLRSATINPTAGSTGVEVCFDKVLNTIGAGPGAFHLVGYRAGNVSAAASNAFIDQTNTQCAIVVFPASVGDLAQYTAVEVSASAVIGNSALALNLADSVGLTGSTSHAGTTGVTTGPNLVGVLAPTGTNIATNSLTFVYDKPVTNLVPTQFLYVDPAGNTCTGAPGGILSGDGTTTVTVAFTNPCSAGGGSTVATAVRAGAFINAMTATSDPGSSNPDQIVVLPNAPNGGATQVPDLVSATINPDQDSVTFTFNKNVVVRSQTRFVIESAIGGTRLFSTGATGNGGTTVVARYGGQLAVSSEFGVIASTFSNTVAPADNPTGNGNPPESVNVGDNAGAFARAFTTGPEVFGATASKSSGAITVNLDDRISTNTPGNITLLDTTGNVIAAPAPAVSFNSSAPPGPAVATLQYPASSLTNLGSIQFAQGAFTEPAGTAGVFAPVDAQNITQIVSPVSSAAILKGYKSFKAHHHSSHKKHTKKHTKKH